MGLTREERNYLMWDWSFWGRPEQQQPPGRWNTWIVNAGRGFGKTRLGAEWVRNMVCGRTPLSGTGYGHIALVGETAADVRDVMVQGPSGILAVSPPDFRPKYTKSERRLEWPNGAVAITFSAVEPEQLRGPQNSLAWCFIANTLIRTEHGEVPISEVSVGRRVSTSKGLRCVVDSRLTQRDAEIWEVRFSNGAILEGTAEHPVRTVVRGFVPLSQLRVDEEVVAWHTKYLTPSSGTAESGISQTSIGITGTTGTICATRSTERSGKRNTALFRRATTFITLMKISLTMRLKIWSAYLLESMSAGTTLIAGSTRSPHTSGAARTSVRTFGVEDNPATSLVSSAEKNTSLSECGPNSAIPTASKKLSGDEEKPRVLSVALTNRREAVYNITVEDTHEYFANGILVHNCDEIAKWAYPNETWDQLQFGMRVGDRPMVLGTTTPKPIPLMRALIQQARKEERERGRENASVVVTSGSTYDNAANLASKFLQQMRERYEGTRLGRQELQAELLDDVIGALWTRRMFDVRGPQAPMAAVLSSTEKPPRMTRVVVAVDPSGTSGDDDEGAGDAVGIVAAGLGIDGLYYILADDTCNLPPSGWSQAAVNCYRHWGADRIVAERNYGGAMVEYTIRTADKHVSYSDVTATRGKTVRAEPIAALYERGKVLHVGSFPDLENELCSFTKTGYVGGNSPNRADALVWALTELIGDSEDEYDPHMYARLGRL